ncbi:MAG: hypothetical protein ACNS60_13415 [Candidatus Cyclobacteriaceae bacterium M2_1C_046]
MLGLAAGGAVALLATTTNSRKTAKKAVSKSTVGDRYSIGTKKSYDDSEVYYI